MKFIPRRAQLWLIALAYAAVLVVAATLLYERHLQELKYPAEASGGMWAGGDLILDILIACPFMVPTVFLIWVTARFEAFYTPYSKFLLGLRLSAPVCLSVLFLGEKPVGKSLIILCLYRLIWSPFILVVMATSRLVARLDRERCGLEFRMWSVTSKYRNRCKA